MSGNLGQEEDGQQGLGDTSKGNLAPRDGDPGFFSLDRQRIMTGGSASPSTLRPNNVASSNLSASTTRPNNVVSSNLRSTQDGDGDGDGSKKLKRIGQADQIGGLAMQISSIHNQHASARDQVKSNAKLEQNALRTQQRADFGSMLAQSGQTGLAVSSFSEIFTNQAMEDGKRMAQLKKQEAERIAALKNSKRGDTLGSVLAAGGAIVGGIYGGPQGAAMGASLGKSKGSSLGGGR